MKEFTVDAAVIGGGPAGLAAALEAKRQGVGRVILLERDFQLGGILPQCIHDGFGLHRFGQRMTGSAYAQTFVDEVEAADIDLRLDTMVLEITDDKIIYACNKDDGILKIRCGAIILAMGCRERTASQVLIHGYRPSGVMTAGSAQRYINLEGYLPGKRVVILGSGDIGLIMARRMKLEGMEVVGVYEVMKNPGGLTRNVVQCLEDYDIPLHLSTTVTRIHGKDILTAVTVTQVDENRKPIPGTEKVVECDLLVLAVGLIPENELSVKLGIQLDPKTKGPVLDNNFMTSKPGIFAAGNVAVVFDLVDYVSLSGEIAARGAAKYLKGQLSEEPEYLPVGVKGNLNFVVPQRIRGEAGQEEVTFFMRVREPDKKVKMLCENGGAEVKSVRHAAVAPPEMLACDASIDRSKPVSFMIKEA